MPRSHASSRMSLRRLLPAALAFCAVASAAPTRAADASPAPPAGVSYRLDVMAVLSKHGCNQGTCHGNQNGKGGFKLSLRGQNPRLDHLAIMRDQFGRRVDHFEPGRSLLLEKATAATPHGGGQRFAKGSPAYALLRDWIAGGAPDDGPSAPRVAELHVTPALATIVEPEDRVQIRVEAVLFDGSRRDVTRMSCYEVTGGPADVAVDGVVTRAATMGEATVLVRFLNLQRPVRLAFVPERQAPSWPDVPERSEIDRLVFAKLRRLKIAPSALCDDATFLRRAHVDLIGTLPTPDEARSFLADMDPDKRERLVERLLDRPEFADYWALKWSDLLRNEERTLDRKGVQDFHQWLRRAWAENWPLDRLARELVSARGSTYTSPAANFYRANRDPITRAEATAQVFLGLRLQCAKCHNHPFDRWTQDDYYGWTAAFDGMDYKILSLTRRDKNDGHEFDGEQIVYLTDRRTVKHPELGDYVEPRFLGQSGNASRADDRLEQLGDWLTAADNRLFAQAQANRLWFHLLGRGIVEPIDDFRASNPPSNPELLDWLTGELIRGEFDARRLIREIMRSSVYQLSAVASDTNADDEANFARAAVRPLQAEVLLDAVADITGAPADFNGYPAGTRAIRLAGVRAVSPREARPTAAESFLEQFGKPPRLLTCECERAGEPTLRQTFQMISGPVLSDALRQRDNRLAALLKQHDDNARLVDEMFLLTLCRAPNDEERAAAVAHLRDSADRRAGAEDVLWSLLNSKEFLLRH